MIELGSTVQCKLTGFKGIATGRSHYLYGCDHICIQPSVGKDGTMPKAQWFDEPQLKVLAKPKRGLVPKEPLALTGGPRATPRKPSHRRR